MPRSTLQKLQKAVLDQARAEEQDRKRHDRQLYTIGRLVEAAGLFDLDQLTFTGMLASCADDLPKMQERWRVRGEKLSLPSPEPSKTPARAIFASEVSLSKQARAALAAEGLKEIRKLDVKLGYGVPMNVQLWSGAVAEYDRADSVVTQLGGELQRLGEAAVRLREAAE